MQKKSTNNTYLKFLVDFMEASGIGVMQVASLMGLTRQSVYHWFVRDDMKISQVYDLFRKCGYSIRFSLERDERQEGLDVVVDMRLADMPDDRRLSFLRSAMNRYGISRDALAEALSVGKSTVAHWFAVDECFISYIYKIAACAGLRLAISINPL